MLAALYVLGLVAVVAGVALACVPAGLIVGGATVAGHAIVLHRGAQASGGDA